MKDLYVVSGGVFDTRRYNIEIHIMKKDLEEKGITLDECIERVKDFIQGEILGELI